MMKLPHMDLNTLSMKSITDLNKLLKISKNLEQMKPRSKSQKMHDWILEQLRHFNVFNSRFVRKKIMEKSSISMRKNELLMFSEPISRAYQGQAEIFIEALNTYYSKQLEKDNV